MNDERYLIFTEKHGRKLYYCAETKERFQWRHEKNRAYRFRVEHMAQRRALAIGGKVEVAE